MHILVAKLEMFKRNKIVKEYNDNNNITHAIRNKQVHSVNLIWHKENEKAKIKTP